MPDQAVGDFHNLQDIDLIAVGRCTRIFPNEHSLAIGEPFLRAVPAHQRIGPAPRAFREKRKPNFKGK